MAAKILMPAGIQLQVRRIVVEQADLNRVVAGTIEEMLIERMGVRADPIRLPYAFAVLKFGRLCT
jgi:hypothetical protein